MADQRKTGQINFGKGRSAKYIITPGTSDAREVVKALGLHEHPAVILMIGGAAGLDDQPVGGLDQLISRGIARAANNSNAAIIDGGTHAGVMALIGQGVADRGHKSPLIGVAPAPKVTYPGGPDEGSIEQGAALDPNHDYFVLVDEGNWGDEADLLFRLAKELARDGKVVTVLANGGPLAKAEVLRSVRNGWPIIVIEGSGELADDVARCWREKEAPAGDGALTEIIAEGKIQLFSIRGLPVELRRLIVGELSGDSALRRAWRDFGTYDSNAAHQQDTFSRLLSWVLWLGVAATALAVANNQLNVNYPNGIPTELLRRVLTFVSVTGIDLGALVARAPLPPSIPILPLAESLKYAIMVIPITISILVAVQNHFKTGKKWVLLRGSAEAVKREIFYYRTATGSYRDEEVARLRISREVLLARRVGNITRRLTQTEVNELALKPFDGSVPPRYAAVETDDGMSPLTLEQYVASRLDDQVRYFDTSARKLQRRIAWRRIVIYILGGLGTFLAAIERQVWIAVTTAVATALTAHVEHFQWESTLVKYNQSKADLGNIKSWWSALTEAEKADSNNRTLLVESTERILESELTGWVQRMQDAMEKISAAKEEGATDPPAPQAKPADRPRTVVERATGDKRPSLCTVFVSETSALASDYPAIKAIAESFQLVCERIEPTELFTEDSQTLGSEVERVDLMLIDFSTNPQGASYLATQLRLREKKFVALMPPGIRLNIETDNLGKVVEIRDRLDETAAATLRNALAELLGEQRQN